MHLNETNTSSADTKSGFNYRPNDDEDDDKRYLAHMKEAIQCESVPTCLPLWMRLCRSIGVLPVVTQMPAKALAYTSLNSIRP